MNLPSFKFPGEHDKAVAMYLFYHGIDDAIQCLQNLIKVRDLLLRFYHVLDIFENIIIIHYLLKFNNILNC